MAETSSIQWTDATWNIAVGCTKVDEDCKYCYMYRGSLDNKRYDPKVVRKTKTVFNLPLKLKWPTKIFTSSLTDVFHEGCDYFREEMWDIIRKCPQHTFQILTKRPERIMDHLPADWGMGWDNVWLGVSAGSQVAYQTRVEILLHIPCKTRFVSIEPLHQYVDVTDGSYDTMLTNPLTGIGDFHPTPKIHWIIVGGESGNENGKYLYRPCELSWILDIVTKCQVYKIPVFVKQLGTYLSKQLELKSRHGGDMSEWPSTLQIRQFPNK